MRTSLMFPTIVFGLVFSLSTVRAQSDEGAIDRLTEAWFSASICVESAAFHFFLEENLTAEKSANRALTFCRDELDAYSIAIDETLKKRGIKQPQQDKKIRLRVEKRLYDLGYLSITGQLDQ